MTINPWDAKNGLFYRARPKSVLTGLRVLFTILNPGFQSGATIRPPRRGSGPRFARKASILEEASRPVSKIELPDKR